MNIRHTFVEHHPTWAKPNLEKQEEDWVSVSGRFVWRALGMKQVIFVFIREYVIGLVIFKRGGIMAIKVIGGFLT